MRDWFQLHPQPDTRSFVQLCNELNNGVVRQQRQKVSVLKLKIWWRNEKQRLKKLDGRGEEASEGPKKRGRKPKAQQQFEGDMSSPADTRDTSNVDMREEVGEGHSMVSMSPEPSHSQYQEPSASQAGASMELSRRIPPDMSRSHAEMTSHFMTSPAPHDSEFAILSSSSRGLEGRASTSAALAATTQEHTVRHTHPQPVRSVMDLSPHTEHYHMAPGYRPINLNQHSFM